MIKAFSILPENLRYNNQISAQGKILWCEIYAYNYAKIFKIHNKTLAADLGLSETQVSRLVSELKANNYILTYTRDNQRHLIVINPDEDPPRKELQKREHEMSPALAEFYRMLNSE